MQQLTTLEMLKLSLEYSISKKHQKSLLERISILEGKPIENKPVKKKKKMKVIQESFL